MSKVSLFYLLNINTVVAIYLSATTSALENKAPAFLLYLVVSMFVLFYSLYVLASHVKETRNKVTYIKRSKYSIH